MKMVLSMLTLGSTLLMNTAMAANYTCVNLDKNVELTVNFLSPTVAEVNVKSPFQKQMNCEVNDFTNGVEVVKGLACENNNNNTIPDVLAINEKTMKGMIEVSDQPHYDLDCK